jgi:uncharacterized protein YjbI with pentapeptide repeats
LLYRSGEWLTEVDNMDREEALKLLSGGRKKIRTWNHWRGNRKAHKRLPNLVKANLSGADLSKADLSWTNIREADLRGANLVGADLTGADLIRANLTEANLSNADVTVAKLSEANLTEANLSGADLRGANLVMAALTRANLLEAKFSEADLSGAYLMGADLMGAKLSGADLSEADFSAARLMRATLSGADLSGTNLSGADLSHADLIGANVSEAGCSMTVFANVDLSEVKGLDSVRHRGPSTLGIDTILRSNGRIPESFLRGCGVPEVLIEYLPSLINSMEGIQFHSVFISYSHKDEDFAKRLHSGLQGKGVRCWYAPHDLPIGAKIRPAIDSSIQVYDKLLLVLSEHSVNSQWVEQEVETALRREREENATVLFPVRLDDAAFSVKAGWPALITNTRNIGDFRKWKEHDMFQATFGRLLRDLKAAVATGHGDSPAPAASP